MANTLHDIRHKFATRFECLFPVFMKACLSFALQIHTVSLQTVFTLQILTAVEYTIIFAPPSIKKKYKIKTYMMCHAPIRQLCH